MTRERAQILEFRPRSNAPAPIHGSAAVQVETQEPIHTESIDERYKALVSRVRNVADDWIHGLEDVVGALSEARSEGAALRNQNASLGSQLRVSRTRAGTAQPEVPPVRVHRYVENV